MITTIAIMAAISVLFTLFVLAIFKYSGEAIDKIMQVESNERWKQVEGLDGKPYWLPEDNKVRTQSTIK